VLTLEPLPGSKYAQVFSGAELDPAVIQVLDLFERSGHPFDLAQPVAEVDDGLAVHVAVAESTGAVLLQIWRGDNLEVAQVMRIATRDGKLPICHHPHGKAINGRTIYVAREAWPAHLSHGDQLGPCAGEAAGVPVVAVDPLSGLAAAGTWYGSAEFVAEEVGVSGGTGSLTEFFAVTPLASVPVDPYPYPPLPPVPAPPTEYPFDVNLPEVPVIYEDLAGSGFEEATVGVASHCEPHPITCPDHNEEEPGSPSDGDPEPGDGTGSDECDEVEHDRLWQAKEDAEDEVSFLESKRDDWVKIGDTHSQRLVEDREALSETDVGGKLFEAVLIVGGTAGAGLGTFAACHPTTLAAGGPLAVTGCRGAAIGTVALVDQSKRTVGDYFDERARRWALEDLIEFREEMIAVARTGEANVASALENARISHDEAERAYDDFVFECAAS
jgi:hypothetical protein